MRIRTVRLVYFSPTGTTKRVLEGIAAGIGTVDVRHHDLTLDRDDNEVPTVHSDDLVIFGVPVYSGRVVRTAIQRLRRIRGDQAFAVPVVVYGNRDFDDALLELSDLVRELGFTPMAAAAFVGEHSFSTANRPIAVGRPDGKDIAKANDFGSEIRTAFEKWKVPSDATRLEVPGNTPYIERDRSHVEKAAAQTVEALCTRCETCESVCPTGAITLGETVKTETVTCILCNACVKACPTGARVMNDPSMSKVVDWLYEHCKERREPQIYI